MANAREALCITAAVSAAEDFPEAAAAAVVSPAVEDLSEAAVRHVDSKNRNQQERRAF